MSANYKNTPGRNKALKAGIIEGLKKSLGIVSPVVEALGISRSTYYRFLNEDPEFKKAVEEVGEYIKDYVESRLFSKIQQGDSDFIQYYLDAKAKDRGYGRTLTQENIQRFEPSREAGILSATLEAMKTDPDYKKAIEAQKQIEAKTAK